ncbi:hypothetical protein CQP30_08290 [Yersinia pestis]|uniref:Uncharacterized protein n=3 Tax=Yersinia pestis TaxID=632 RepID=A0A384KUY2_YERPE|nr:hypothetical protein YPC_3502 [Yersinia pestis biovar Medievalis str. Harbin 35]ANW15160.1 hypothetical protein BAY22_14845 [Yersinia pestis]EDM41427.1 hypothetical protein YPE_0061 [Yersinia pestis CA88-4125]EDR63226.1 conserved hypothetical protein [Yersinia pestis biovar Antiqua str. UG05-0454]EEO77289.1 hypothetical protein YP516_0948 [Yersinia pestis Nepal516]EEO79865.1 hypothetical protein YPF_3865 [Yersinia pestis biovar Orientalis str. India 195]EEO85235.1 hypothetical protein YPH_
MIGTDVGIVVANVIMAETNDDRGRSISCHFFIQSSPNAHPLNVDIKNIASPHVLSIVACSIKKAAAKMRLS